MTSPLISFRTMADLNIQQQDLASYILWERVGSPAILRCVCSSLLKKESIYLLNYLGKILDQHNCWSGDSNILNYLLFQSLFLLHSVQLAVAEFSTDQKVYISSYKNLQGTEKTSQAYLYGKTIYIPEC